MRRAFAAILGIAAAAGPALAQTTGNLLVNPGGELGQAPWMFGGVTEHYASGPTNLGFVTLSASEGTAFFYTDRTFSSDGLTASGSVYQTVDVRGLGAIGSVFYGGDLAHIAEVLAGSGQVGMIPIISVEFYDEADGFLDSALGSEHSVDPTAGLVVFDGLRYETTKAPPQTAFIRLILQDNISLQSNPGMQLQVRFVTRIDNAYLAVAAPEAGRGATGAAAIAALVACAALRRNRSAPADAIHHAGGTATE